MTYLPAVISTRALITGQTLILLLWFVRTCHTKIDNITQKSCQDVGYDNHTVYA